MGTISKTILLIDDDYTIREIIKRSVIEHLKGSSKIYTSGNGLEGLGLISLQNPDLIVLDTTLPKYAGMELMEYLEQNTNVRHSRIPVILIHEDSDLPSLDYPNVSVLNKNDPQFLYNLELLISNKLKSSLKSSKSFITNLKDFFAKRALTQSNKSDVLMHKAEKSISFLKVFFYFLWFLNELSLSIFLTFYYLFSGGRVHDENNIQRTKDTRTFRVRFYPTLTSILVATFIGLLQVSAFVFTGVAILNSQLRELMAQQVCPLPASPEVINTRIVVTPDNVDGVIDCASLDIIVGSTGEIVFERYTNNNGNISGDWGVTMFVNNLTVQNGGKITADGQGYQIVDNEIVLGKGGNSAGQTGGAGGGHGGAGGQGVEDGVNPSGLGGNVYGQTENPTTLGSAGGSGAGSSNLYSKNWDTQSHFTQSGTNFDGVNANALGQLVLNDKASGNSVNNGLVAYYKFDESSYSNGLGQVIDSSSSNKAGNPGNNINTSSTSKFGRALEVNGSDQYVSVPDVQTLGIVNGVTVSAWVYARTTSNYDMIVRHENGDYVMYAYGSGGFAFDIVETERYPSSSLPTNQWVLVTVAYDNPGMRIYFDGVLVGNANRSVSGTLPNSTSALTIGNTGFNGYIWGFNGFIDDVRLYNRALSQSEITDLYNYVPPSEYVGGEKTWTSETIDAGSLESIKLTSLNVDWELDGSDSIAPKIQLLASTTGSFSGEEVVYPSSSEFYQNGGTYNIQDGIDLDLSSQITSYYKYYKVRAVLDTGSNLVDSPKINSIQVNGNSLQSGTSIGGAGGGSIKIISTGNLALNGIISANGLDGQSSGLTSGGGGAGGSIWIEAESFSGNGVVEARGGSAANVQFQGGGGGGGRIMMFCNQSNSFSGSSSVEGGITANSQDGGVGTILGPTCRPNEPSILKQYRSNQTTELSVGGISTDGTAVFVADMADVDLSEGLSLQVELRAISESFTGVPTHSQTPFTSNPKICNNSPVNCGKVIATNIPRSQEYQWRARVRDNKGGISQWVEFGGNSFGQRDLLVTNNPNTVAIHAGDSQSGIVGTQLASALVAKVTDSSGFPIPGHPVEWYVTQGSNGGLMVGGTIVNTNENGESINPYQLGRKTGVNKVQIISRIPQGTINGSFSEFNLTGLPGALSKFSISAPVVGITNSLFGPVTITALDIFDNVKTDYIGTPSVSAVQSLNTGVNASGSISPNSITYVGGDQGVKSLDFTHNFQESIKLKLVDGSVTSFSNSIGIVDTLGACPDVDGIIDNTQTWNADANNLGVFDCRGLNIVVTNTGVLNLVSFDSGDNNWENDYGATVLADNFTVQQGGVVSADASGYRFRGPSGGTYNAYGGFGYPQTNGTPYGSVFEPDDLGTGYDNPFRGGGAIKLSITGTTEINGLITSSGEEYDGQVSCGIQGGTGGSIWIDTNVFNGSNTAIIKTNGSRDYSNCGNRSPSGGRIAIYYSSGDFLTNNALRLNDSLQSRGALLGAAGTVYLENRSSDIARQGTLVIDNRGVDSLDYAGAALLEGNYKFKEIRLSRKGALSVLGQNSTLEVESNSIIQGDSTIPKLIINGTLTYSGLDVIDTPNYELVIKGDMVMTNSQDINVGVSSKGTMTLFASTWARNLASQYSFGDVQVGAEGTLNLRPYISGTSYNNDYPFVLNATNILVSNGGLINSEGFGYGSGPGTGQANGPAHGGYGGGGSGRNTPYGDVFMPRSIGSGAAGDGGSFGGGAITLNVSNTLTLNGRISANGVSPSYAVSCGPVGGTGGSLFINTSVLNGASTGQITSNGASVSNCPNYSASGGRIAIHYTSGNLLSNIQVKDSILARGGYTAGAGTIYIEQMGVDNPREGNLYIDNNNQNSNYAALPEDTYNFKTINQTRRGNLEVMGDNSLLLIPANNTLVGDSTLSELSGRGTVAYLGSDRLTVNGLDLNIKGFLSLISNQDLTVGDFLNGEVTLNAQTWAYNELSQVSFRDILIGQYGRMQLFPKNENNTNYTDDYAFTLNADNLSINNGGIITADGLGYSVGPGGNGLSTGASHGGFSGGPAQSANPYGDVYQPLSLGSGFANGDGGSFGGGAIKLNVFNELNLNGLITANGLAPGGVSCGPVGGTGGSIWIQTSTLNGSNTGIVRTNAADVWNCPNRSSSGGRIAIYYTNGNYITSLTSINNNIQSRGAYTAGPGTVYIEQEGVDNPRGAKLYIDNNNVNSGKGAALPEAEYTFSLISLSRRGNLDVLGSNSILNIASGNVVLGDSTSPNLEVYGTINYSGLTPIEINGYRLGLRGRYLGVNNLDFNIGAASNGGLNLYANTWYYNQSNPHLFGNMTVGQFGVVDIFPRNTQNINTVNQDYGVNLSVQNLTVANGGVITTNARGYSYGGPGYGGSGGPAYGGVGGGGSGTNVPYGDVYEPTSLGSSWVDGSVGGGALKLTVLDTLDLSGTISANGFAPSGVSCGAVGGTGGSLWLIINNLVGNPTAGRIQANAGSTWNCSGTSPSGGRVAVYYNNGSFINDADIKETIQARGGYTAGAGTVYLEQVGTDQAREGSLFIDNNNTNTLRAAALPQGNYQFKSINLTRKGNLDLLGQSSLLTLSQSESLKGDSSAPNLEVYGTFKYNGSNPLLLDGVTIGARGRFDLDNNNINLGGTNPGGLNLYAETWYYNRTVTHSFGDVNLTNNSIIRMYPKNTQNDATLTSDFGNTVSFSNLNIENGSSIFADGFGYSRGPGRVPGSYGASHGGYASNGSDSAPIPYGNMYQPTTMGSGHASGFAWYEGDGGSFGGGAFRLNVSNTLTLNGTISANGVAPGGVSCGPVGGSGGSVWVDTNILNGSSGIVSANGASVWNCGNLSSSGGRIAIYYTAGDYFQNVNLTSNVTTRGGYTAGPGTIYVEQRGVDLSEQGSLYLDNNGVAGRAQDFEGKDYFFRNLYIGSNVYVRAKQDLYAIPSNQKVDTENAIDTDANMIGLWSFEESTTGTCAGGGDYCDRSGNSRNLTANGTTVSTGKVGNALSLDGSSFAEIVLPSNVNVDSFTISAWVNQSVDNSTSGESAEIINFNNISTTSSLDVAPGGQLRFEWPSKFIPSGNIVSRGKPAILGVESPWSSTNPGGPSCVDGDYSTICHTQNNPTTTWLQIDLQQQTLINKIRLWNITNTCCNARFRDFKIEVSNTGTFTGEQQEIVRRNNIFLNRPDTYYFEPVTARYVRVTQLNVDYLNLAEVEIYEGKEINFLNQWRHLIVSYNAATGKNRIYVDGELFSEEDRDTNYTLPLSRISIGKGGLGSSVGWVGLIDEVALYNKVLQPEEIIANSQTYSLSEYNNVRGRGPVMHLTGNYIQLAGSTIDGRGLGFPSESGFGRGIQGLGQSGGAGGSHGGSGGSGQSDGGNPAPTSGPRYGLQREPLSLGSGGGRAGTGAAGGSGGGAFAVRARTGDVNILGTIDMRGSNGLTSSPGGGGGAGGSILIEAQTCDINGNLTAAGGAGGDDSFDGGGGGGGRISILYTQGPCNLAGTITVAQGSSASGQSGQVGTYPALSTIPATPSFREQYKSDGSTPIPVGGFTPEQVVTLKTNVTDPGATSLDPRTLAAEFEVVGATENFTEANIIRGRIIPRLQDSILASTVFGNPLVYTGGTPLISEASITGLIPGNDYKWRARVVNTVDGINGSWIEFGNNASSQADFVVSNTSSLQLSASSTTVNVGETISVTVRALNNLNNTDNTYTGTVEFASSLLTATLPSNYAFTSLDSGERTFANSVSFNQPGNYTLTVTDVLASTLIDTINITVNGPTAPVSSPVSTPVSSPVIVNSNFCAQNPNANECILVSIFNLNVEITSTTSVRVCFETNIPTIASIAYGEASLNIYNQSIAGEVNEYSNAHCIDIPNLKEDSVYIFEINATAQSGRSGSLNSTFATDESIIVEISSDSMQCISIDESGYAFNANSQAILNYSTIRPALCVLSYGNDGNNLEFTSASQELVTTHQAVMDLRNLDGVRDLFYRIECNVSENVGQCVSNGVIPASKYLPYMPQQTMTENTNVAPIAFAILTAFTLIANIASYPSLFFMGIPWFFNRRKGTSWGIVIDRDTKEPIPFVTVRLSTDDKVIKQIITGFDGKYGFIVNKGEYSLELIHGDYNKEIIKVDMTENEGIAAKDIELGKKGENGSKDLKQKLKKFMNKIRKNLRKINLIIAIMGLGISIIAIFVMPNVLNIAIICIYLVQLLIAIFINKSKRDWGYVYEESSYRRLKGVSIRVFSIELGRQIDVQISDEEGRFGFNLKDGEYYLQVNLAGYDFADGIGSRYQTLVSPTGYTLVKAIVQNGKQINLGIPLKRSGNKVENTFGV